MGDRILFQFANEKQAEVFFKWFKEHGFDELCQSDMVHDDLPQEEFYQCISADELPGKGCSDPMAYYIEIE